MRRVTAKYTATKLNTELPCTTAHFNFWCTLETCLNSCVIHEEMTNYNALLLISTKLNKRIFFLETTAASYRFKYCTMIFFSFSYHFSPKNYNRACMFRDNTRTVCVHSLFCCGGLKKKKNSSKILPTFFLDAERRGKNARCWICNEKAISNRILFYM